VSHYHWHRGLAERKAEKAASFNDAISYSEKRIACLEKLPVSEDLQKKIIDSRVRLGLYMTQLGRLAKAKETVEPIIDLAVKRNYRRRLAQIYTIVGAYYNSVEEDFSEAIKYLGEARKLSEESNDTVSLLLSTYWMGLTLAWNCEFDSALYHLEKALEINVAANSLWGISTLKTTIAIDVYHLQGKVGLSYQTTDEALRIAEESGDMYSKAMAYSIHGYSWYRKGFLEEAEAYSLKGVDCCERINFDSWLALANLFLAETYFDKGEYQKSRDCYHKQFSLAERGKFWPWLMNLGKIGFARAKVMNNERDIDLQSLYDVEDGNKLKAFEGWMLRYIGEILLNIDDQHVNEAEDWVKKAIKADEKNGTRFNLGQDYALYAELFKRKGDQSKAKENLNKAIEIMKECGADGWVKKYEKELAALH